MKKGKKRQSSPSYLKGLGGAALGSLIAFLMWIMVAYFVGGNLHLSFGFVLALFAYYGYFAFNGKKGKGFFAIFLPMVFAVGFFAALISFGMLHMNSLGFTGSNFPVYASAYYGGNLFAAYLDTLGQSMRQILLQIGGIWPSFAIGVIYEAVGAMCYGVRAGKQMVQEKEAQIKDNEDLQGEKKK